MAKRSMELLKQFEQQTAARAVMAGNAFQGDVAKDIVLGLHVALSKKMGLLPQEWSDEKCLLTLHKYRYEMTQAPDGVRMDSRRWLEARGFHRLNMEPWPEGDLP